MKDIQFAAIEAAIEEVDKPHLTREAFIEAMGQKGYSPAEILRYAKEKEKRDRGIDLARRR